MKISYTPNGTCSRLIEIEVENDRVTDLRVVGGCNGNLKGISALCIGRRPEEIAAALRGITCGNKSTSCPDQIACALESLK